MADKSGLTDGVSGFSVSLLKTVVAVPVSVIYVAESLVKKLIPRSFRRQDISGQTALVTGGGSGLGREIAVELARSGVKVVIWGRNLKNLEETRDMIERETGECKVYQVDVSKRNDIYSTANDMIQQYGKIDILVNNAGYVQGKPLLESDDDKIKNTFDVNVLSNYYITKAFLPKMIEENKGHIVNLSSLAGHFGANQLTDYCASKFALNGFTEALTAELDANGHTGISTTLVTPYLINTGMFRGAKSLLIPVMDQTAVAKSVVDCVKTKDRYCTPIYGPALVLAVTVLPQKAWLMLCKATGFTKAMSSFTGKHGEATQNGK